MEISSDFVSNANFYHNFHLSCNDNYLLKGIYSILVPSRTHSSATAVSILINDVPKCFCFYDLSR